MKRRKNTKRQKSQLLDMNKSRYLSTLEHMLEGFQIIGYDWTYLYVNDSVARQGGKRKEELLGHKMWEVYPGIESTRLFKILQHCMEERVEQHMDNEFTYPDGSTRWFELSIQPAPEGILILSIDITGRKTAEDSLRQSHDQFRLIAENVDDMIAVVDLDGKRLYNSPSYRPILGEPDTLRWTDSFEEILPDDRDRIREIFNETIRTGTGHRAEYRLLTKDGTIRFVESQGSAIHDERGKVSQVIIVSRDVTEKRQLEKQFLRIERMESIATLAGGIAHDLNNVLAPILLSLDVLRKRLPDETSQRMFSMLTSTVARGSGLIKQLLSFARGLEGEHTAIQLRHLVDEIAEIISGTFPKGITVRTDIPRDLPPITGDATQLHQVLMNLSVNARDAMPNGGILEIRAERVVLDEQYARMHVEAKPGQYVSITVTDQGSGIPPAIIDRIFEPFFTTKEVGKGTGLGLSTVVGIVKSHNGFVNVYSEIGRGTTFKIYFPAQESIEHLIPEEREGISAGNGECILVVDDEASIREITRTTLESYNYSVLTAGDGTEGVATYVSHSGEIALVLTDMVMPYLDGMAMIRALKKLNQNVRVLAMSGLQQDEEVLKKENISFLHKPFTSETLLRSVHEILSDES